MSNNKKNSEQNKRIELTASQQNPYLARPQDFKVEAPNAPAEIGVPGHGQQGASEEEQKRLFEERKPTRKGAPLPLEPGKAAVPHTK